MKRLLSTVFGLMASLCSLPALSQSSPYEISLSAEVLGYADLTPMPVMKDRIREKLVGELKVSADSVRDLKLDRMFTSDWFMVSVEGKQYVVDNTAKNWLRSDLDGFFVFDQGVRQVAISNDGRESLMKMRVLLQSVEDLLPSYGRDTLEPIYAFIDVTCPHCRKFHLTQLANIEKAGHRIVYVPFLRDMDDYHAKKMNLTVFCKSTTTEIKSALDEIYLKDRKDLKKGIPAPTCNNYQKATFDFLLANGERYGLIGSPMFLTPVGEVVYGGPALERYLGM